MSVRIVQARSGTGWEYDIRVTWPEGGRLRERGKVPLSGKDASRRWASAREAAIFAAGKGDYRPLAAKPAASACTFAEHWPIVVRDHYRANRKKPSTIDAAETIYRRHLGPALGEKPLDQIKDGDVAALKGALAEAAPKTVNNVLSVLSKALHCAVRWGSSAPCHADWTC